MYIIGITGGIACGKSTVSKILKIFGAEVISADTIIHTLMIPNEEIFNEYVKHFGQGILNEDKTINRKKISDIIFQDEEELKWVNEIAHPKVLKQIRKQLEEYQEEGTTLVILDVPLLIEAGWEKECDEVWVVYLSTERQVERLMKRNNITREKATSIIKAQLNNEERLRKADIIIDNNQSKKETRSKIKEIIRQRFPHLLEKKEEPEKYMRFKMKIDREIERIAGIEQSNHNSDFNIYFGDVEQS